MGKSGMELTKVSICKCFAGVFLVRLLSDFDFNLQSRVFNFKELILTIISFLCIFS